MRIDQPPAARPAGVEAFEHTPRLERPPVDVPEPVGERYRLIRRLGEGALGTVWEAEDTLLMRRVAFKTLSLHRCGPAREQAVQQVLDEARTVARLSHAHIVTVHDAGISAEGAYITMELLHGQDLGALLRRGWRARPEQAALIVRRVADALGYAHSKGVIHQDIKPANLFMVGRTRPMVLDFGIARLLHRHDEGGPARGSPHYAAPEQYRGWPCDARSDIHSLGVVLYELLTGQRPFQGRTLAEIEAAVLAGRVVPPCQRDPTLPAALERITLQALDPDPARRHRTAGALARDLRTWLASQQTAAGDGGGADGTPGNGNGSDTAPCPAVTATVTVDGPPQAQAQAQAVPVPVPVPVQNAGRPGPRRLILAALALSLLAALLIAALG
ncbi:serine/threonine-protein kinase [Sphaerotilus hippei]|uniref:Serine/threonine-protein kinase n=1 Tax=Sphaerotilus hippei TaxID=744406 RepID=A0A318H8W2_9BURK|nr:serine/threonine-protein kinase [Sphaerotilus hippei]PXW98548.1 serine/threonine-protein kinase [Sphaerotilus hippei]